jgi:D-xylose transport system substrate-binding protein
MTPRTLLTTLLVALALLFAACSDSKTSASEKKLKRVGFLLSTLQEERYEKDRRYFEEMARSQGLEAFTLAADNDNARQLAQVEDALSRGVEVLVVQPTDSAAAAGYVAKAHQRGVKLVAYDRAIPGADFYVAHDSHKVGVLQAEEAVRSTGGKGNFVLLLGQSGHSVASEIARGYHDVLDPLVKSGQITVVLEKSHDAWAPEQALRTVEDALTKTQGGISAILANNSGMARGAVQAVQARGLGDKHIFIAGADADAANVNYVCEQKQSVEVLKDIRPLAEKAAEVAAALAQKKAVQSDATLAGVPVVAVPVMLIKPSDVKPHLVDTGFHQASVLRSCGK